MSRAMDDPISSNKLQAPQAGVARFADDDVVVHGDAERAGHRDDLLRHLDVGVRRRWIKKTDMAVAPLTYYPILVRRKRPT
jgi:hypothetical protein